MDQTTCLPDLVTHHQLYLVVLHQHLAQVVLQRLLLVTHQHLLQVARQLLLPVKLETSMNY